MIARGLIVDGIAGVLLRRRDKRSDEAEGLNKPIREMARL